MVLSVKFQERIQGLIKHDGACLRKYLTIATRLLFSKKKTILLIILGRVLNTLLNLSYDLRNSQRSYFVD